MTARGRIVESYMIILGLNAFHGDSIGGARSRRQACRGGGGGALPPREALGRLSLQAIAYCLREAGLALSDVHHVAVNQDSRANLFRKLAYLVTSSPRPAGLSSQRLKNRRARENIPNLLAANLPGRAISWPSASDRTSSRASVLGLSRFAIR